MNTEVGEKSYGNDGNKENTGNSTAYLNKPVSKLRQGFNYILVFLVIMVDTSFVTINTWSGTARIIVGGLLGLLIWINNRRFVLLETKIYLLIGLVAMPVLSAVFDGEMKQLIIIVSCIFIAFIVSSVLVYPTFQYYFTGIIDFLCLFSLVALALYIICPSIAEILPVVKRSRGITYYNGLFAILSNNPYATRNYGIFWEPGAFAIFINIVLYHHLFSANSRIDIKRVVLYTFTIITTLSTLGIICMMILFGVLMCTQAGISKRHKLILGMGLFAAGLYLVFSNSDFMFHVFGKLNFSEKINSSTGVRLNAVKYPLQAFLTSPLVGIGYDAFLILQERFCSGMATMTLLNWYTIYGVLGGTLPTYSVFKYFNLQTKNLITKIGLFLFSLVLFSTENFVQITFIYLLIFYSQEKRIYEINTVSGN